MENLGKTPTKSVADYSVKEVLEFANVLESKVALSRCIVIMTDGEELHVLNNVDTLGNMMSILTSVAEGIINSSLEEEKQERKLQ